MQSLLFEGSAWVDEIQIFPRISFTMQAGSWTCMLGPSGVGKTTYIKNLCSYLDRGGRDTGAIHSVSLNKCKGIPKEFCEINSHNIKTDLRSLPWFFFLALKNKLLVAPIFLVFRSTSKDISFRLI